MPHSVILTTPMPTWEEIAQTYRLSKAERKFVEGLFDSKSSKQPATATARVSLSNAKQGKKRGSRKQGRR
jgi:hypothetical protein